MMSAVYIYVKEANLCAARTKGVMWVRQCVCNNICEQFTPKRV